MASSTATTDFNKYKSNVTTWSLDEVKGHLSRVKASLLSSDCSDAKFKAMTKPLFAQLGVNTKTPLSELRTAVFEKYAHLVRFLNTEQDMSEHDDMLYRQLYETVKILRAKQPIVEQSESEPERSSQPPKMLSIKEEPFEGQPRDKDYMRSRMAQRSEGSDAATFQAEYHSARHIYLARKHMQVPEEVKPAALALLEEETLKRILGDSDSEDDQDDDLARFMQDVSLSSKQINHMSRAYLRKSR